MWRKSSYSGNDMCVLVDMHPMAVVVRDSKHPHGPGLCFTADEWAAFIAGAKAGEFDDELA